MIDTDRTEDDGRPWWREHRYSLHGPTCEASVEWNVLSKHGFAWSA